MRGSRIELSSSEQSINREDRLLRMGIKQKVMPVRMGSKQR